MYAFLRDLGFRTTKGVWPVRGPRKPSDHGDTCDEPAYLAWCLELQAAGFEIGYHNTTLHTSTRDETARGLDVFSQHFGSHGITMAQHYYCDENIYWGDKRVSGLHRLAYNVLTRWSNAHRFHGDEKDHPLYWGDLCRARIRYLRNFAFADINTLKMCPQMPYHDPTRPDVVNWYACTEGANVRSFAAALAENAQERLEDEGGACILYTHFGHGFVRDGRLEPRFKILMERLASRPGWFVPVGSLLDHLQAVRGADRTIQPHERRALERRWLLHKVRFGTA